MGGLNNFDGCRKKSVSGRCTESQVFTLLIPGPPAFPACCPYPSRGHDRLDLPVTIRSVHRPFEDRERQELGSPDERLQDSSDPDTGSEEEGSSRLSPPHSPRGEVLAETWLRNGVQRGYRPLGCSFQMEPASESTGTFRMVPNQPLRSTGRLLGRAQSASWFASW